MFEYTKLPETVRYDNPCWPGFYVLIIPNKNPENYNLYLTHERFGVIHYMCGLGLSPKHDINTIDDIVRMAHYMMDDYLPDFVKDCCTDEDIEE